jgi:membrane protein required for colicin V production
MTWVDLAVLAVMLTSGLLAFLRGFVREALGIGAWLGAAYFAMREFPAFAPYARAQISDPNFAVPVAYGLLFVAALIVLSVVASLASRLVRDSALGGLDRTIGLAYGLVRGAVLVAVAYVVAGMVITVDRWPEPVLQARVLPYAYDGAAWIVDQLPSQYRPKINRPPAGREASSQALLQATPQGSALFRARPQETR